jgi:predicted ATPase
MAIKAIEVSNVLVFRQNNDHGSTAVKTEESEADREGTFRLDFCDGINVLIGENGVGKSSLLKMIYAAAQWSKRETFQEFQFRFMNYFSNHLNDETSIHNAYEQGSDCVFSVYCDEEEFIYRPGKNQPHDEMQLSDGWDQLALSAVLIPTTEMLTHAKGFLAMYEKYKMPFDRTQADIIVNASLPETKRVTPLMKRILEQLSDVIDGTVEQKDDVFYVVKRDGRKVDFSLEAEGFRKLGLLWKLIRNGLLEDGAILLWDEPEANLNPEIYELVAEILLELQQGGVQVFVATHSYNFAKYLEIRRTSAEQVRFHNLY